MKSKSLIIKVAVLLILLTAMGNVLFAGGQEETAGQEAAEVIELKLGHLADPLNPYALGAARFA